MLDLENPQAGFVLAAYGLAALGLLGLWLLSWRAARRENKEWNCLQEKRRNPSRKG
jgi:hypothetical protein